MTIATTQSSATDQGNGVTTLFNYNFLIPSATDAIVTITNTNVSPAATTTLASSQYVITGIDDSAGGTVQYPTSGPALAAGWYITISRILPFIQTYQISNQGDFYPQVVESALDYQMMCLQQLSTQIAAASFPEFTSISGQSPIVVLSSGGLYVVSLNPITASSISNSAVTTAKIADGAATLAKLDRTGTSASVLTAQGAGNAPIWAALPGASSQTPPVRQTVLASSVDSNGLPNFITTGSGLAVNIAATTTPIYMTAANGFAATGATDRIGAISADTTITGLTASSTNYLFADIASNGVCTLGKTTLGPAYQWGGAYSTTNGQFTFNISVMSGQVGNGATAAQAYRVFIGEAVTNGSAVTSVVNYALQGRFASGFTATIPASGTQVSYAHNIGANLLLGIPMVYIECTSGDAGYSAGDRLALPIMAVSALNPVPVPWWTRNSVGWTMGTSTSTFFIVGKAAGAQISLTAASWKYAMAISRGW